MSIEVPQEKFYAGIGSRETPPTILTEMALMAGNLHVNGWTLRTGGAKGADTAFAEAVDPAHRIIYVPWEKFQGWHSSIVLDAFQKAEAMKLASDLHPGWGRCSRGARLLHARNVAIILGENLDKHSSFVICWTPGGKPKGGTAMGIRIAKDVGIPVVNLGFYSIKESWDLVEKFSS